jgi:hypothetical protein
MKKFYNYFKPLLLLGILLLAGGCTNSEEAGNRSEASESEQNVRTFLQNVFTGPNEEQENLLELMYDGELEKHEEEFAEYIQEHFKPYLSERFLENYVVLSNGALRFVQRAYPDYVLEVEDISLEEKEGVEGGYIFTVKVSYTNKESDKSVTVDVEGNIYTNEEGKITSIRYMDDVEELQNALTTEIFPGEKDIREIQELNKFDDRSILLPTYAPFKIHEVGYEEIYSGRREVQDNEIVYVDKDDLDYLRPKFHYYSNDEPNRELVLFIAKSLDMDVIKYDEILEFGDGLKGYYRVHQKTQFFTWEQDGVFLDMGVTTEDEEQVLSVEEIIKIAESFEKWKLDTAVK